MADEHEMNADFTANPADLARTIVKRPMMYMGARPSADVVRAFVGGLKLAVLMARGTSPLSEDDCQPLRDLPDGDCSEAIWEIEPLLVALLTALNSDA